MAHYSVEAVSGEASPVTLSFNPYKVTGFLLAEVDGTEVVGTLSGVTITVPEPASLVLLTLGGLALLRRKQ